MGAKKSKGAAAVAEPPAVEMDVRAARSRVLQAISKSDGGLDLLGVAGSCGIDLELAGRALAGLKGDGFIIEAPPGHYYVDDDSGAPDGPMDTPEKLEKFEEAQTAVLNALIDLCGPDGTKGATMQQIEKKTGIHVSYCAYAADQLVRDGMVTIDDGKWRPVLPSLDDIPAYDHNLSAQQNFGIDPAPAGIAEADPNANGTAPANIEIGAGWPLMSDGQRKVADTILSAMVAAENAGGDGMSLTDLQKWTYLSNADITPILVKLEARGLIEMHPPGVFRRIHKGESLEGGADPATGTPEPPAPAPPTEQPARLTVNQADNTKSGEIIEIPIHRIHPNLDNPRKHFDDEALSELTENIRQHGLLQPIVVTERRDSKLGPRPQYVIICGERRYRACNNLHFEHSPILGFTQFDTIPAIVRDVTAAEAAEMALAENVARRDINAMEEARAIQRILELHGADENPPSQREIALRVGLSQPSIANALKLTELPPDVQDAIQQGKLTASHGRALSRFAKWPEAQSKLAAVVIKGTADGRPIPAIRLEGDLYGVLNLIASDDGPCVYMPGDAWRSEYIATCRECPYDSFILSPNNWDRAICARPAHLRQLIAEEEAAFEARAEEARAKLAAQRTAAVTAQVNDAIERAGIVVRSGQLVTADALGESLEALEGSRAALGDSSSESPSETPRNLIGIHPSEAPIETDSLPQLSALPKDAYRNLFPGDGCGSDCYCYARALDRDRVVEICVDPARFDARVKEREKAEKKNSKRLLEEVKAGCAENINRSDHPEVIRRAAVLAAAPPSPGQLANQIERQTATALGIDLPKWNPDRHRNLSGETEAMLDAFAAMPLADLVRLAAMRAIRVDFENAERGHYNKPAFAAWFARPLPPMEPEPAGVISETAIRLAAAEDDHRELQEVIAERDALHEQLEKARAHSADQFAQINKLRATQRREEELAGSDYQDYEEVKRQRSILQCQVAEFQSKGDRQHVEMTQLKTDLLEALKEIKALKAGPKPVATPAAYTGGESYDPDESSEQIPIDAHIDSVSEERPTFRMGDRVKITAGTHAGRAGDVTLCTGAAIYVDLVAPTPFGASSGKSVRVPVSAVELVGAIEMAEVTA